MVRQTKKLPGSMPPDATPKSMAELSLPIRQEPVPEAQPTIADIMARLDSLDMGLLSLKMAPPRSTPELPSPEVPETLARLETAVGTIVDIMEAPRPMVLSPEDKAELVQQVREGLLKALTSDLYLQKVHVWMHRLARFTGQEMIKAKTEAMAEMDALTATASQSLTNVATQAIRGMRAATSEMEAATDAIATGKVVGELRAATGAMKGSAETMVTMVNGVETFLDELDYVSPAVLQNGERRLRRLTLQAALIGSLLTVLAQAALRAMGVVI